VESCAGNDLLSAAAAVSSAEATEAALPTGAWLATLDLQGVKALFLYGLGGERDVELARQWVDASPDRWLIWLNEDVLALRRWANNFSHCLRHPRLRIEIATVDRLQELASYTVLLPYAYSAAPHKEGEGRQWQERLEDARMRHDSIAVKLLDLNTHFYPHFYANLCSLPHSLHAAKLEGKFRGIPAIICGAGPSLDAVLPVLRRLENQALLFGCGSALTALTRSGLRPHLGAGFCTTPEEAERFFHAAAYEIPILYRTRLNAGATNLISGFRLYTNGSCGLEIVDWAERELGIEAEPLQEGPSIIYLATELAYRLGCDPIVYVGLDLAYTAECSYAVGVGAEDRPTASFRWEKDICGQPIRTKLPWICEARLLQELITSHPGPTYLNATGGGIGLPKVPNLSLSDLALQWPQRDLAGYLHAALVQATMPHVTSERVQGLLQRLRESLNRCLSHLEPLSVPLSKGARALHEVELQEEIAYEVILEPMLRFRRLYLRRAYEQCPDEKTQVCEQYQTLYREATRNCALLTTALASAD
jgi:hypothetical protein